MLRSLLVALLAVICSASVAGCKQARTVAATEKYDVDPRWSEEEKADFQIRYSIDRERLDIGIGEIHEKDKYPPTGVIHSITFTFEELEGFWKEQRHKQFIVVVLDKWAGSDEDRDEAAKRLTEYFFEAGFRRVLIRQGVGNFAYWVISDSTNPKPPEPPR